MSSSKPFSSEILSQTHFLKNDLDIDEVLSFYNRLKQIEFGHSLLASNAFFVFDYSRLRHILLQGPIEGVIGYKPQDFLYGGLDFFTDIFHPEDFRIFDSKCQSQIHSLFKQHKHSNHSSFIFEMNFRVKKKKGGFAQILQKGRYITDEKTCLPKYSFGTCSDISLYKRDTSIVQIVKKYTPQENNFQLLHVATNYYYPNVGDSALTKREREVLLWISDGLSTKQIAGKIHISENTIANHRKNMLRKANVKNVAELIRFGILQNII
jgi:DNA-binding CsgD family transcriptional regulator